MSTDLRSGLIRLAFANPELRADLLPLIEKEAAGPSYKDYVEKKRKKGEKPLAEDAWESRVKGKGESGGGAEKSEGKKDEDKGGGGKTVSLPPAESKKLGEALGQWHASGSDPIYAVSSNAYAGKPIPADAAKKALDKVNTLLQGDMSAADKKQLSSAKAMLEKLTGEKPKGKAKSEKPKASFKKNYRPTMESVMTKHSLTDDDAAEVIKFSIDRPKKGKEQSPAELMRRFMEHAKPETKERMKGMNPAEFMKMLRAVLDDEEGGGKTASLRAGLIRLAYANPELRPTLLPLLEKHAGDDEAMDDGDMGAELEAEADPTSHDQNLPEHYYFGKTAEERLENIEKMLSQFASPASKGQNKPQSYYGLPPKGKQAAAPKVKGGAHPLTRNAIVYFDLVLEDYNIEEDADNGDEFAKSLMADNQEMMKLQGKDLASLKRMFGTTIMDEGHGSDDALVCKFSVDSWADVKKANDVINRHHTGGDDNMGLDVPYFEARSFRLYPDGVNNVFYSEESQAKGDWNEWLSEHKASGKQASVKTAGGSGAANAAYLRQSPLKNKILQAVAKHYGTSVKEIEAELTDPDAEAVFEYIGNDAGLQMQVYRDFKSKGFR